MVINIINLLCYSLPLIKQVADLLFGRRTFALLVKELLLATAMAAIVIIFTLIFLIQALEALIADRATLNLRFSFGTVLIAAARWSVLNLTAFFTNWKAAGALASITKAKAAVLIRTADFVPHATLTADLVVRVTGPRAALPE